MLPSPRQHQHGVEKIACIYHDFYFRIKEQFFVSFTILLFALSRFGFCTAYQNQAQRLIFVASTTYQDRARFLFLSNCF